MSIYYKESNDEELKQIFNKKIIYRATLQGVNPRNIVNFHFGEKYLYGRVDTSFSPMIFRESRMPFLSNLKSIKNKTGTQDLKAVHFVVDNFDAMAARFKDRAARGLIDTTDPYLSNIKAYKAYESTDTLYTGYLRSYFNVMAREVRKNNSQILNFEDFVNVFMSYLVATTNAKLPFTQPAFVKSKLCPLNVSGLVIEIADMGHVNDDAKINSFVNSKNWEFFVNTCNTYGFMVDMNAPWRLVADLDTISMLTIAASYNLPSIYEIFSKLYISPAQLYFDQIKKDLLKLYNTIKPLQAVLDDGCKTKIITPIEYSIADLDEIFGVEYFLNLYMQIRFLEEESQFSEAEQHKIITEGINLFRAFGKGTVIAAFETILNKPFDYQGSLSYYVNAVRKREQQKDAETGDVTGTGAPSTGAVITGGGY